MPAPDEAEFDQLVGPAEDEFDKLVGPGSDQQQILNATSSPNFRIGHGQEMPVTKIEGGPQPDAYGSAERGVEGKLLPNALENVFGVDPNKTYNRKLSDTVDPEDWARATQHMEELSKGPGQAAKDLAASTAAMAAGAPVGLAGQAGLSALQAGTARMADDPSATPGDIATSSGLGAGVGVGAGLATKLGAKLVSAGNRGLARLVMGPGEIGRLRGLGGEAKLENLGQRIRDAELDQPRNLLQRFTPTDAKRVADNAAELTAGSANKIHGLEDDLLKTNDFGQSEIDTRPLTSELRGATRPNSAEVSTDATQAAMERQAQKFDVPSEQVPVSGSVRLPPPLPGSGDVKISRDLLANGPSATPWKPSGVVPETQGVLDLGQQQALPLPEPEPIPAVPAAPLPEPSSPPLPGQQALPLPAPEPPPRWSGPAPQPPAEQLAMGLERLGPKPPSNKNVYGEIGADKPLEATASVSDPYTVERAVQDKRDIGKRLFDKKQRAFVENHGEDEAREISWRFLRDRFQKALDEGAASGAVNPEKLADYRKASADFHTAADVQVDTAKRAETELRRSDRLFYGGAQAAGHAMPGTQYNLGRLLEKAKGLPPAAVAGLPSTGQPGAERAQSRGLGSEKMSFEERKQAEKQANEDLKSSMFGSWYTRMVGK